MQGLRRTRAVVGLDLGTGAVKAVEIAKGALSGCGFSLRPFEEEVTGTSTATAIRTALRSCASRATRAVVGLDTADVIVHRFSSPGGLPPAEIEEFARAQAGQATPYPSDEACYDFVAEETGRRNQDFRMVIARSGTIAALCRLVEEAGMRVAAVDVTALALQRILPKPNSGAGALVVLDGGHRQTRLMMYSKGELAFEHSQPFGCAELARRLRAAYGLSPDDTARAVEDCALPGGPGSRIRDAFLSDLARHARRALQLCLGSRRDGPVPDRLLFCGGAALVYGASRVLEESLALPVSLANPLNRLGAGDEESTLSPVFLGAQALALNDHA